VDGHDGEDSLRGKGVDSCGQGGAGSRGVDSAIESVGRDLGETAGEVGVGRVGSVESEVGQKCAASCRGLDHEDVVDVAGAKAQRGADSDRSAAEHDRGLSGPH
jgi:hypothetical protein